MKWWATKCESSYLLW